MQIQEYTIAELQTICTALVKEFSDACGGRQNSLVFAKHHIIPITETDSKKEQVMVIGGSNCFSALVEKREGLISVISQQSYKLPLFHKREILLEFIALKIDRKIDKLGLNFAYPLRPVYRDGKLDGELVRATKEHGFQGLVGENVGHSVECYMKDSYNQLIDVVTANDTVCLVLSGLELDRADHLVAGVVGTGFNFGFYLDDRTVVNLESGNFDKFQATDSGQYIDNNSHDPGLQRWEKEVAGAYLYMHYNYYSDTLGLNLAPLSSTEELSILASANGAASELARSLMRRSAELVAVQIAALYNYKQQKPVTVIIEGSLFWKGWHFYENVRLVLRNLDVDPDMLLIHHLANSSILGAARLIM